MEFKFQIWIRRCYRKNATQQGKWGYLKNKYIYKSGIEAPSLL